MNSFKDFTQNFLKLLVIFLINFIYLNSHALENQKPNKIKEKIFNIKSSNLSNIKDPWVKFNRGVYTIFDPIDTYLLLPSARFYDKQTPVFFQKRVTNFFVNYNEVGNFINATLQFRPIKMTKAITRFVLNTTIGIVGLFDFAGYIGIKNDPTDFSDTLKRYGVGPGNFLWLFIMPSDVRDTIGRIFDIAILIAFPHPFSYIPIPGNTESKTVFYTLYALNARAKQLPLENLVKGDRYYALRNLYIQNRDFKNNGGMVNYDPLSDNDNYYVDEDEF